MMELSRDFSVVPRNSRTTLLFALLMATSGTDCADATTFTFGLAANLLTGQPNAILAKDGLEMQLAAGPVGAGLVETVFSAGGLGVDSSALGGGGSANVFEILSGSSTGEYIQFSFDHAGFLTGIDLDGVKDELLEFFRLESSGGLNLVFVDSTANMPDNPHPVYEHPLDAAIGDGALAGEIVHLWEVAGVYDDEVYGLHVPFAAGEQFKLTFGTVGAPYSQGSANGARLQGIEVQTVPEPATLALVVLTGFGLTGVRGMWRRN